MAFQYKLKEPKLCSCGRTHTETRGEAKVSFDEAFAGVYWNCACGSTLWAKPEAVIVPEHQPKAA